MIQMRTTLRIIWILLNIYIISTSLKTKYSSEYQSSFPKWICVLLNWTGDIDEERTKNKFFQTTKRQQNLKFEGEIVHYNDLHNDTPSDSEIFEYLYIQVDCEDNQIHMYTRIIGNFSTKWVVSKVDQYKERNRSRHMKKYYSKVARRGGM